MPGVARHMASFLGRFGWRCRRLRSYASELQTHTNIPTGTQVRPVHVNSSACETTRCRPGPALGTNQDDNRHMPQRRTHNGVETKQRHKRREHTQHVGRSTHLEILILRFHDYNPGARNVPERDTADAAEIAALRGGVQTPQIGGYPTRGGLERLRNDLEMKRPPSSRTRTDGTRPKTVPRYFCSQGPYSLYGIIHC